MNNPYREPQPAVIPYTDKEMELWDAMMTIGTGRYPRDSIENADRIANEVIEFRRKKFGVR